MNRITIKNSILLLLIFSIITTAGNLNQKDNDSPRLRKLAGRVDEAVGVMTKGLLQNLTMNYGQITDTRLADPGNTPSDDFFNFRYPRTKYSGLADDFALVFAIGKNSKNGNNGNVIDGYTANNNEDWIAKDGSLGKTHYDGKGNHEMLTWFDGTPYLAHSDLPATWPIDKNGNPFWPGYFRRDAENREIEGEFASDRDVYAVFTDANNQQGDALGIEIEQMAYCYGNPLAEDFQFYEFFIHNTSNDTIRNAWFGHYHDPDCGDYGQETLVLPDPLFDNPDIPDAIIGRDFDGDIGGATIPNPQGAMEDYSYGVVILETPKNIGVTDFHYFLDTGPSDDRELWPIISSLKNDPDIAANASQYFHGPNPRIDDVNEIKESLDWVYLATSGPFDLLPGETVKYTLAVVVGATDADFLKNARTAEKMFKNHFTGPKAPLPPTLAAVAGDRRVTLYWDDFSEHIPDPISGEIDFEGYKIYRSEDDGATWGKSITNAFGEIVNYVPLAQFDLANGIAGIDPVNSAIYLGDDSGLRHIFIDSTVINGKRYAYTITAYDRGVPGNLERGEIALESLESAKGSSAAEKNFVIITPTSPVAALQPLEIKIEHVRGKTKFNPKIQLIDPAKLSNNQSLKYEIRFSGSPVVHYSIWNAAQIQLASFALNETNLSLIDGFVVSYACDNTQGGISGVTDGTGKNVLALIRSDSTKLNFSGRWLTITTETPGQKASLDARTSDYEIRFTEKGSIAYRYGKIENSLAYLKVPFEIWDISQNRNYQINCQIRENREDNIFQYGESIYIVNAPYRNPAFGDTLRANFPLDFPYIVAIWGRTDATPLPEPGEKIVISSFSPPQEDDHFVFEIIKPVQKTNIEAGDLASVRIVPNPYIVSAEWEFRANVRQVRFMYLPAECQISIYTLAGVKVREIHHNNGTGDEPWDLTSDFGEDLAFGVYLYIVSVGDAKKVGKFALIK